MALKANDGSGIVDASWSGDKRNFSLGQWTRRCVSRGMSFAQQTEPPWCRRGIRAATRTHPLPDSLTFRIGRQGVCTDIRHFIVLSQSLNNGLGRRMPMTSFLLKVRRRRSVSTTRPTVCLVSVAMMLIVLSTSATRPSRGVRRPLRGHGTGVVGPLGSRARQRHTGSAESIIACHGASPPQPCIEAGEQRCSTEQCGLI